MFASLVLTCYFLMQALINMISNPVNSTVPIAAEVLKSKGVYDKRKLFGVTTLDVVSSTAAKPKPAYKPEPAPQVHQQSVVLQVRAKTFYAEKAGLSVSDVDVPVIGGHAGITILPLFSQASPDANLSEEQIDQLTKRTQDGGTEVVQAKAGKASNFRAQSVGVRHGPACR